MIIDKLENYEKYVALNPLFRTAFEFLKTVNTNNLEAGKIDIDGDNLFALVVKEEGWGQSKVRMESHIKYIDIQYQVAGNDHMGYAAISDLKSEIDEQKGDFIFYQNPPNMWIQTAPTYFVIFFPEDAHAPMGGVNTQFKIVLKVKA